MFEVSFDRICDVGGVPGFCIRTWERRILLELLAQCDEHSGSANLQNGAYIDTTVRHIESLGDRGELHIENVREARILAAARLWYRAQGYYSETLNTFEIPCTARLTLGICLEDLVYEASEYIDSGGTRTLIAALNDGIIMRILPSGTIKEHTERYLGQSHASIRHLARGLGDGWISTFERFEILPPERVMVQLQIPAWPVAHYE